LSITNQKGDIDKTTLNNSQKRRIDTKTKPIVANTNAKIIIIIWHESIDDCLFLITKEYRNGIFIFSFANILETNENMKN
jgi:hypothetical protein